MESGEHPHEALSREVIEELSVGLSRFECLGFFMDIYGEQGASTLNIAFVCQVDGEPVNTGGEFDEIEWFSISDLLEEPLEYAFKNVEDILNEKGDEIVRIASDWYLV